MGNLANKKFTLSPFQFISIFYLYILINGNSGKKINLLVSQN